MTTFSLQHTQTDTFGAFSTTKALVEKLKEVTPANKIDINLNGFTHSQANAIFTLFAYACEFAHSNIHSGRITLEKDEHSSHVILTVPGLGKILRTTAQGSNDVVLHLDIKNPSALNCDGMLQQIDGMFKAVQHATKTVLASQRDYAIPCTDELTSTALVDILRNVFTAHGFRNDQDAYVKGEVEIHTGDQSRVARAVMINKRALDHTLEQENRALGKAQEKTTRHDIVIRRTPDAGFSAHAVVADILKVSKDNGSGKNMLGIRLEGFNYDQSQAVFALLGMSMGMALKSQLNGPIESKLNRESAKSYIILPGIGSLTATHTHASNSTSITIPGHTLPAYAMEKIINSNREIIAGMANAKTNIGAAEYYALASESKEFVDDIAVILKQLAAGHGDASPVDVMQLQKIQSPHGQHPGIVVRKDVLDNLLEAEDMNRRQLVHSEGIIISKPSKGFKGYATAKKILSSYDKDHEGPVSYRLENFSKQEVRAILALLAHALTHVAGQQLTGPPESIEKPNDGRHDFEFPGIGRLTSTHDAKNRSTIITLPVSRQSPLPAHAMRQIIRRTESLLEGDKLIPCNVKGHSYMAIPCYDMEEARQITTTLVPIVEAHGHTKDMDVAIHPDFPAASDKRPAVLIRLDVHQDIIAKEGLGRKR
ncbi:MAG: hypothetical protein AB7L92_06765 [Alphaproteobacteria bacterium]